jgi:hypothetical protein
MMCCQRVPFLDPIYYDPTNLRIGEFSRCAKCYRLIGDAKIFTTIPKGLRDSWKALSQVYAKEFYKRGENRPLRFVVQPFGLAPLGHVAPKAEIEDQEPPF